MNRLTNDLELGDSFSYQEEIRALKRQHGWIDKWKFEEKVLKKLRSVGVRGFVYDCISLCRQLGIEILWVDLKDPWLRGYSIPGGPIVLHIKHKGQPLQQFDCAHELIHQWFHNKRKRKVDGLTRRIYDLQANWGALVIKLPEKTFRTVFAEKSGDLTAVAAHFNISLTPVVYRALSLRLLSRDKIKKANLCTNTDPSLLELFLDYEMYPPIVYRLALQHIVAGVRTVVKDLVVKADKNGRVTQCPRCGNSDFSPDAKYCRRCGAPLYNYCTNVPKAISEDYCGALNPPDAAFCEQCGAPTLFNRLKIVPAPPVNVVDPDEI